MTHLIIGVIIGECFPVLGFIGVMCYIYYRKRQFIAAHNVLSFLLAHKAYEVEVDYALKPEEMFWKGDYKLSRFDTFANFPYAYHQGFARQRMKYFVTLVSVKEVLGWLINQEKIPGDQEWIRDEHVVAYMVNKGLVPGWIEILWAFGATFKNIQKEFPLVALGSCSRTSSKALFARLDYEEGFKGRDNLCRTVTFDKGDCYHRDNKCRFLGVHQA